MKVVLCNILLMRVFHKDLFLILFPYFFISIFFSLSALTLTNYNLIILKLLLWEGGMLAADLEIDLQAVKYWRGGLLLLILVNLN